VAWRAFAVPVDPGPHWGALILAAAAGIVVTAGFAAWPLSRAGATAPALLFRAPASPTRRRPGAAAVLIVAAAAAAGIGVVVLVAGDPWLAAGFLGGLSALVAALGAAAFGLSSGGRALARWAGAPAGTIRVALAGIGRPGAPTASVVVSLGIGLALLAALGQVGGSLAHAIDRAMPSGAPAYFFIDIQPDQADAFARLAQSVPGVGRIDQVPHLRGRIVRIAGRPADPARVPEGARWALRGDQGLTYAATPPANADIVAGQWWPAGYAGPPLISFDAALARDFGLKVGDTLTYNVLGREITGRIANLRRIDWTDLRLNFTAVFSPGLLSAAPHTNVAAVQCAEAAEEPLMRAVNRAFPNVTAIRVRDVLYRVESLLRQVALALAGASGISLAAGLLVLAGAVAAGRRARLYDAAVLHALGATRRQVLTGLAVEYLLLGITAGLIAAVAGWLAAWAVVDRLMGFEAAFLPGRMLAIIGLGGAATLVFGLAGTRRALGAVPARLLRTA
jgi:putative ABC transport system permease protein